jgi:hypothetical protein
LAWCESCTLPSKLPPSSPGSFLSREQSLWVVLFDTQDLKLTLPCSPPPPPPTSEPRKGGGGEDTFRIDGVLLACGCSAPKSGLSKPWLPPLRGRRHSWGSVRLGEPPVEERNMITFSVAGTAPSMCRRYRGHTHTMPHPRSQTVNKYFFFGGGCGLEASGIHIFIFIAYVWANVVTACPDSTENLMSSRPTQIPRSTQCRHGLPRFLKNLMSSRHTQTFRTTQCRHGLPRFVELPNVVRAF